DQGRERAVPHREDNQVHGDRERRPVTGVVASWALRRRHERASYIVRMTITSDEGLLRIWLNAPTQPGGLPFLRRDLLGPHLIEPPRSSLSRLADEVRTDAPLQALLNKPRERVAGHRVRRSFETKPAPRSPAERPSRPGRDRVGSRRLFRGHRAPGQLHAQRYRLPGSVITAPGGQVVTYPHVRQGDQQCARG